MSNSLDPAQAQLNDQAQHSGSKLLAKAVTGRLPAANSEDRFTCDKSHISVLSGSTLYIAFSDSQSLMSF